MTMNHIQSQRQVTYNFTFCVYCDDLLWCTAVTLHVCLLNFQYNFELHSVVHYCEKYNLFVHYVAFCVLQNICGKSSATLAVSGYFSKILMEIDEVV